MSKMQTLCRPLKTGKRVGGPMFRVITCNTNGIRAAARKGFFTWLSQQSADVVCIQEIKAKEAQLTDAVFYPEIGRAHV